MDLAFEFFAVSSCTLAWLLDVRLYLTVAAQVSYERCKST